jgi:hypothetical protein
MSNTFMVKPVSISHNGMAWHLFSVEFDTADGTFSTEIYALSAEHAAALILELRETARLGHQIVGIVRNE